MTRSTRLVRIPARIGDPAVIVRQRNGARFTAHPLLPAERLMVSEVAA